MRRSTAVPSGAAAPDKGHRFRPDIEGLRALAVAAVLINHAGLAFLPGGFAGVDVFFVVSGFVITTQLLLELEDRGRIDLPRFYARRAKRLLPAAGLVLVVTTVAAWLGVSRVQWSAIAQDVIGSALYVVNWVLANRSVDYMAEDVAPSPVQHFWSLAVEEQFYFIWPPVILGLAWLGSRVLASRGRRATPTASRGFLALGLVVVIVVPSLVWAAHMTSERPSEAFFVTTTRLWELGLGALVALGAGQWRRLPRWAAQVLGGLGLAVIVAGLLLQGEETPWPFPGALVPTLGTAAVIVAGFAATTGWASALLGRRALVWVGGLSYSLYLWHWPVLQFGTWRWGDLSAAQGLGLVVLSFVPAWLSYRLVENPIRRSPAIAASPRLALSLGLNCTLVAVVAGLVLQHAVSTSRSTSADPGAAVEIAPRDLKGTVAAGVGVDGPPLFDSITPDPVDAVLDSPELYAQGCAVEVYDTGVKSCDSGDPTGRTSVTVVGDSKIAQWMPAIDAIAEANGWRVRLYTKGGCTFTDTMTLVEGDPFEECREWGEEVFRRISSPGDVPDVLITSGLRKGAVDEDGEETLEGLVEGYVGYWKPLTEAGTKVIAISDTPSPSAEVAPNAYECVAEHLDDDPGETCSWDLAEMSSNVAMRDAAARVDGTFIDMNPLVCPEQTCRAVLRNVLTYRQGSHVTATFVRLLAPALASELVPAVKAAQRRRG